MKSYMGLLIKGIGGVRLRFPKNSDFTAVIKTYLIYFLDLTNYNDSNRSLGGFINVIS